jgi:hypothetical protein
MQGLAFLVVFENVISLWRLEGCTEEYKSVLRDLMRNRLEKRRRIRQVFGKHRGYNAMAFSVAVSIVSAQRVLHCEPNTTRVSRSR